MGDDAILYATERIIEQIPNIKLEVVGHPVPFMNTNLGRKIAKLPYGRTLLYKYHTRQIIKQIDKADARAVIEHLNRARKTINFKRER